MLPPFFIVRMFERFTEMGFCMSYIDIPLINMFNNFFYEYIAYIISLLLLLVILIFLTRKVIDYIYIHRIFFKNREGCENVWYENKILEMWRQKQNSK